MERTIIAVLKLSLADFSIAGNGECLHDGQGLGYLLSEQVVRRICERRRSRCGLPFNKDGRETWCASLNTDMKRCHSSDFHEIHKQQEDVFGGCCLFSCELEYGPGRSPFSQLILHETNNPTSEKDKNVQFQWPDQRNAEFIKKTRKQISLRDRVSQRREDFWS